MSVTRWADAVTALLGAYTAAPALAGVPVYDGAAITAAADLDFVVVGHDGTTGPDGALQATALAGTYAQAWADTTTGMDEAGVVQCLIVCQTGDPADVAGRRGRVKALLAAAEDAALAATPAHLTFDGSSDGRWIYKQAAAGVVVMCAYRVAYSAPWG
jgi:L-asparaginase II